MADVLEPDRGALAGRYTIERELGRGGNAVVYLAHDVKHDRKVALKVLLPELALAVRAERFLREIQIAAKLTHPHILALHDSGEVDGLPFYVMPYVKGESLRDRLNREKQLPVDDALGITRDVAEALGYAHKEGVVHRDIKPENIMLSEGGAIVADFGIARALTVASGQTVTESGIAVGTPAYMSPEQGSGEAVDGRSDLYSLGCVLYEMLAGHPPFSGSNAQEILGRHALDAVPAVRAARAAVPVTVEQTITKALAKQPADRFAAAPELAEALDRGAVVPSSRRKRVILAVVGAGFLAGVLFAVPAIRNRVFASADLRSLAVMPCKNLTLDSENVAFSQGMADELISDLGRIPGLNLSSLTSALEAQRRDLSPQEAGRLLHVANVLECSVRRAAGRMRMSAHLVRAADGRQLWTETYDRELTAMSDVIAVQENIAQSIVHALRLQMATRGAPLVRRSTENMAARDLYDRGRLFWTHRDRDGISKAIDYFSQAIALDSRYAQAWSGLADAYDIAAETGYLPRDPAFPRARDAALRAVALDSLSAEGYTSLGRVRQEYDHDWKGAGEAYRRAIQLDPSYAMGHSWYAAYLSEVTDQPSQALAQAKLGQAQDPLMPSTNNVLAIVFRYVRRWNEAVEYHKRAVDLAPDARIFHNYLARDYKDLGRYPEALAELDTVRQLGMRPGPEELLGEIYLLTGKRSQALAILQELERDARTGNTGWNALAQLYLAFGQKDQALAALEKAVETFQTSGLRANPVWDPLRSDPRFKRLLQRPEVPQ